MDNNTRKIVVLNDLKSKRIEQAIFILRDEAQINETDAVSEAERIVELYLENTGSPLCTAKIKKHKPIFLNCAYILCVGVCAALFAVLLKTI